MGRSVYLAGRSAFGGECHDYNSAAGGEEELAGLFLPNTFLPTDQPTDSLSLPHSRAQGTAVHFHIPHMLVPEQNVNYMNTLASFSRTLLAHHFVSTSLE